MNNDSNFWRNCSEIWAYSYVYGLIKNGEDVRSGIISALEEIIPAFKKSLDDICKREKKNLGYIVEYEATIEELKETFNFNILEFDMLLKRITRKEAYKEYLKSDHWQEKRKEALKSADNKCQLCNSDEKLNVHHRTYANLGNEDKKDLTVLCEKCHQKFHGVT